SMFTAGQSLRMDATLYGPRAAIVASDGLQPPDAPAADIWAADSAEDIGAEPNTASPALYISDDVWVRNQDDGVTNQEHQPAEFRPPGSPTSFVYVRIRNRGCGAPVDGTVKLYWAKASSALSWPKPWDGSVTTPALMGNLIGSLPSGSIAPGSSTILKFPWAPPNPADYVSFGADRSHFCLLARIETSPTPPFGMAVAETADLGANVRDNNNIVWKNIEVVDDLPGALRRALVTVANFTNVAMDGRL